jgi:hypothetical protein
MMNSAGLHADSNETLTFVLKECAMATNEKRLTKSGKTRWDFRVRRQGHALISRAFDTRLMARFGRVESSRDLEPGAVQAARPK